MLFRSNSDILVYDADTAELWTITDSQADDVAVRWSPDGSRLLFCNGSDDLWSIRVYDLTNGETRDLINVQTFNCNPVWSPDGRYVAFESNQDGNPELYLAAVDDAVFNRLTYADGFDGQPAWGR